MVVAALLSGLMVAAPARAQAAAPATRGPTVTTAAAAVPPRAARRSAQALAQQARRQLESTPHVSVLSTTLEWRTERLCDVVYVLRQSGRLVAYAGQIKIDSRGHAHFRGLTGLRRI